ncbi:hypothetical protein CL673_09190 [Candidatus Bathyarchaeota archaeon]|nr:hypothetical protein [Candidatus Bathyarchaeota archaeon]
MFKLKTLKSIGFKRLRIIKELTFPDGQMLIFGRNESGKSTIMESIHYGIYGLALRPSKRASNDDLIAYGYPQAVIELAFSIDNNEYNVKRVINRKGTNVHELVILRSDGKTERVTGARAVNNLILEELHGIDSDALLNSCLVEQKSLGKLEAAVRAKRIEAMTSLLNLEAFLDAQQDLKKSSKELERKNQETLHKLSKAKQAKTDYEEAEEKLEKVQTNIKEILADLKETEEKRKKLEQILAKINRINEIKGIVNTKTSKVDGKKRELKRVKESLREAEEAVEIIKQIEEELPKARLRFDKVDVLSTAIENLQGLESQLENARGDEKRARERLTEAEKKVDEAEQASEQLGQLNKRINKYEPAKIAQDLFSQIESSSKEFHTKSIEIDRLRKEEPEIKDKLEALNESENLIDQLEKQERELESTKNAVAQKRTIGFGLTLVGILSIIGNAYSPFLLPLGGVLILIGAILVFKNVLGGYDLQFQELRTQRENLLGEKTRISEYQQSLEKNKRQQKENEEALTNAETELTSLIPQLPSSPREYSAVLEIENDLQNSVVSLRDLIQEDLRTLVKVTTKRDANKKVADDFESRKQEKDKQTGLLEDQLSEVQNLEQQCRDIEEKHEINTEQADSIKAERDESQKKLQELYTNREANQTKASQKEKLAADSQRVQSEIHGINKDVAGLTEERDRILSESEIDLTKEEKLRSQNEELKARFTRLNTEKKERTDDVKEAKNVMDKMSELKNEYPKLNERNDEELFDLEAMRKAVILIDATRDGILGGVKKRIESHMVHFLPALTNDRYSMVRIDKTEYRIEIFDREAKRWRGKGVFSGATQDQFSLALRLAFALSTIPSTRGARPGFIFLDEPLSGFDAPRTKGFMTLLQKELPKYFDQIIVISHLEALQDEFQHNLQLEAGQIVQ